MKLSRNIWILAVAATVVAVVGYYFFVNPADRPSTEDRQLTAEEVVDLEVQAEQEFLQSGGTYE